MTGALLALAILGKPVPEWPAKPAEQWVQGGPLALADLRGKVVLIRFFMDADCPYCRASAPSLNELYDEFAPRGLVVIGMYTPKPKPRPVTPEEVRGYVKAYGFKFPVAIDEDWGALNKLWLNRVPDAKYTSSSLLIDRGGILRKVHEGGVLAKDEMREAIVKLLAEPAP